MERKWWALITLILVLVIVIVSVFVATNEVSYEDDELEYWSDDFIYGEWYIEEVSEEGEWLMYNPELGEYINFNNTWIYDFTLDNGSIHYTDPLTEKTLIL